MKRVAFIAASMSLAVSPVASAQEAVLVAQAPQAVDTSNTLTLAANTALTVRMNEELNTRRHVEGHTFHATVVGDVMQDGYVIIPAGSRAVGSITWLTKKGAFGKSGKMDIAFTHVEVNGTRVPVVGTFRQEGEGNTVATVGTVIAAGVFAAFVTGRSGVIPAGRELEVHTRDNLRVALPAGAAPRAAFTAYAPVAAAPVAVSAEVEQAEAPAAPVHNAGVRVE